MNPEQDAPERPGLVRRLLTALVGTVCRFPRVVLAASILLSALSLVAAATRLQYHTQRSDLLSPRKDSQKRWRQYLTEFGDDDDIVVVVKGVDREPMRAALEAVAAGIRDKNDLFDRLFYKVDLRPLHDRALLFLKTEQIESIRDNLRDMGPLLDPDAELQMLRQPFSALPLPSLNASDAPYPWQCLGLLSLLYEADLRVAGLKTGTEPSATDRQFFTQLTAICRTAAATLRDPAAYANPWLRLVSGPPGQKDLMAEPQYFFSGDGTLAFLLCRPIKAPGSFTAALKPVAAVRAVVAAVQSRFPDLELGLTGLPVLETDEMAAAQHDTALASWLAVAGVTVLFFVVYRGVAYPLLTILTLLIGTSWAMGWLTLTVGHLNILSATFAVMLIGMGDYGVLWVMRYEQARRQGLDVGDALLHTTTHVAVGNLTAASTLALAFFAAILADFRAVAELGWIAGCGVLLCAFGCFTVLPSLLMLFDRRGKLDIEDRGLRIFPSGIRVPPSEMERSWLPAVARRPAWVLAGGLLLTGTLGACALRVPYDHNLLHLQAAGLDSVKWEQTLIQHTAGASWHALSCTDTPDQALALKERYERLPGVSMVVEVATLVPRDQEAKRALLADIRDRLRYLPKRGTAIPHPRPNPGEVETRLTALLTRLWQAQGEQSRGQLSLGLEAGLRELHQQLRTVGDQTTVAGRLQEFDQRLAGDLAEDLHLLRAVAAPVTVTVADLPAELRERYVGASGKWLLRVFARDSLWDFEPLARFTEQIQAVDPEATGKPFGTVEGLRAMKDGLQRAGLYALLVIVAVLALDFRCPGHVLIALTPLAMGVVMLLGLMGVAGLSLNPANMIAFPLVLGVGIDNGVHVLHDYLLRRAAGRSAISYAIGRGVLVKALTTMIGFGTLMISTERGLAGLGLILTLGVGCCMLTALVFLPAVLHLLPARATREVEERTPTVEPIRLAA
jgi:hopanoid biosynthesis associated RND transporter like protein HpnN